MSDLVITAADVSKVSGSQQTGVSAAALGVGQAVYLNSSNQYALAEATSAAASVAAGLTLNSTAAAGQAVAVQTSGVFQSSNAPFTAGQLVCVSAANAGGITDSGNIASTNYTTFLGIANSTSQLTLGILVGGVAHG